MTANLTTAAQRSMINVPAVFTWQPVDGDGVDGTAGTVTVDVIRANGTSLVSNQATVGAAGAPRTYSLAATYTAITDVLTAVWKDAGVERARTTLEVVGAYFASITDIRNSDSALANTTTVPNADLIRCRTEVEHAFTSITACDFTPRYHRERVFTYSTDAIVLTFGPIRSVRSVVIEYAGGATTVWTAGQLALLLPTAGCVVHAGLGNVFPFADSILVEYESGYDTLPFDLRDQFFIEVRKQFNDNKSASQMATPYTYDGGAQAGQDPAVLAQQRRLWSTLSRYSLKTPGIA